MLLSATDSPRSDRWETLSQRKVFGMIFTLALRHDAYKSSLARSLCYGNRSRQRQDGKIIRPLNTTNAKGIYETCFTTQLSLRGRKSADEAGVIDFDFGEPAITAPNLPIMWSVSCCFWCVSITDLFQITHIKSCLTDRQVSAGLHLSEFPILCVKNLNCCALFYAHALYLW